MHSFSTIVFLTILMVVSFLMAIRVMVKELPESDSAAMFFGAVLAVAYYSSIGVIIGYVLHNMLGYT